MAAAGEAAAARCGGGARGQRGVSAGRGAVDAGRR